MKVLATVLTSQARHLFCVLALLLVPGCAYAQAQDNTEVRNGEWWQKHTEAQRLSLVVGMAEGIELGLEMIEHGLFRSRNKTALSAASQAADSLQKAKGKFFGDITVGNIVDGINAFYKDYRNKRIRVPYAMWIVLNSIAGTSQEEVDKLAEYYRRLAMQ